MVFGTQFLKQMIGKIGGIFSIFLTKSSQGYKVIPGKMDNRSLYITEFETQVPKHFFFNLIVGSVNFILGCSGKAQERTHDVPES